MSASPKDPISIIVPYKVNKCLTPLHPGQLLSTCRGFGRAALCETRDSPRSSKEVEVIIVECLTRTVYQAATITRTKREKNRKNKNRKFRSKGSSCSYINEMESISVYPSSSVLVSRTN